MNRLVIPVVGRLLYATGDVTLRSGWIAGRMTAWS